jgi:hypothetical protein
MLYVWLHTHTGIVDGASVRFISYWHIWWEQLQLNHLTAKLIWYACTYVGIVIHYSSCIPGHITKNFCIFIFRPFCMHILYK